MSSKPRTLLLGGSGQLGTALVLELTRRDWPFDAPKRGDLDLTALDATSVPVDSYDVVINAASYTAVDEAESAPDRALAVNARGAVALAGRLAGSARLVQVSTDYVFSGDNSVPYVPSDTVGPVNVYGESKVDAEVGVRERLGERALIVRTAGLFSSTHSCFVRGIAKKLRDTKRADVVVDQRMRPTAAAHLAAALLTLIEKEAAGTLHVTDGGADGTWYDVAREIAASVSPSAFVNPISAAELDRPARRPAFSVLDLSAAESLLGQMPDWRWSVRQALSGR